MDEEDLADAAEAQRLQTSGSFAGLGWTEEDAQRKGSLMDVFKTEGETMGVKLLRKMGWRDGQGIGAKVRRKARLDDDEEIPKDDEGGESHWFAPQNTHLISFTNKNDSKGLGYAGEARLDAEEGGLRPIPSEKFDEDEDSTFAPTLKKKGKPKRQNGSSGGGLGVGVLNDTGSDDEDPYEIGPKISYSKVIGGTKKKKMAKSTEKGRTAASSSASNPLLGSKPVFISKRASASLTKSGFRKCHDGRLPLEGFLLATDTDELAAMVEQDKRYPPPEIPKDWKSSKRPPSTKEESNYQSVADAAKASALDPQKRASLLGEAQLPGKSVFDYLSPAARDRIASASGKQNLPAGLGESAPKGFTVSEDERQRQLRDRVPDLDKDVAIKALGRGVGGWMPYLEDEAKRARYRAFLEIRAGLRHGLPERVPGTSTDDWVKELHEFAHAAQIFKPMTGMMASRFTSASAQSQRPATDPSSSATTTDDLLRKPAEKPEDPAEAAAKVGMYGPMTRSTQMFFPTRLLCKRFNVRPPVHVQPDPESVPSQTQTEGPGRGGPSATSGSGTSTSTALPSKSLELVSRAVVSDMLRESDIAHRDSLLEEAPREQVVVDANRNDALEAERPGEAVFKAIFGSDDEDD